MTINDNDIYKLAKNVEEIAKTLSLLADQVLALAKKVEQIEKRLEIN